MRNRIFPHSDQSTSLSLSLSLCAHLSIEPFSHNELEKTRKPRQGKRNLENRLALISPSRCGGKKSGRKRLCHIHDDSQNSLSLSTCLNFTCQIFFSKFRNSPSSLYRSPFSPTFSILFSFFFFFENISRHACLSVFVEKSRNSNETERDGERKNCSTWKYTSRLPNSA